MYIVYIINDIYIYMYNLYNYFCHINKCQMYTFNSSNIHKKSKAFKSDGT